MCHYNSSLEYLFPGRNVLLFNNREFFKMSIWWNNLSVNILQLLIPPNLEADPGFIVIIVM